MFLLFFIKFCFFLGHPYTFVNHLTYLKKKTRILLHFALSKTKVLPTDDRGLYESALGSDEQPCMLSAYPVRGRQPVTFQSSSRQANRDVWSKFTVALKMSPGSKVADIIAFVEKWNGQANAAMH